MSFDDWKLGKYDTNDPSSPYYTGEDEEVEQDDYCLEEDDRFDN